MQHYIVLSQGYPGLQTKPIIDTPYYPVQKLLDLLNVQALTIKRLSEEIEELKQQMVSLNQKIQAVGGSSQQSQEKKDECNGKIRRKHFENKHCCPYAQCEKTYGSSLALNLHIKQKHNGGTKKEREAYAKIIFNCQDKGVEVPSIECDFPPGFLEQYRKKMTKKY